MKALLKIHVCVLAASLMGTVVLASMGMAMVVVVLVVVVVVAMVHTRVEVTTIQITTRVSRVVAVDVVDSRNLPSN